MIWKEAKAWRGAVRHGRMSWIQRREIPERVPEALPAGYADEFVMCQATAFDARSAVLRLCFLPDDAILVEALEPLGQVGGHRTTARSRICKPTPRWILMVVG
jgi:hypothetical protein